jgi:lauroyl/myristoyl acyltransferase
LLFSTLKALPAPQRIQIIERVSPLLAIVLYTTNVQQTQKIRENLNSVLGTSRLPAMAPADVRRLLSLIMRNTLISNSLPTFSQSQIVDLARIDGLSYLDDYLASGHPVLIWSYHYGISPLIVATLLRARGYPIHLVGNIYRVPATASSLRSGYYLQQQRAGAQLAAQLSMVDPLDGVQREILDVLKNKECLYVTPDRMIPEHRIHPNLAYEVPVDLLSLEAHLQSGSLRLAKRLGAQVVTVLTTQADGHERRIILEPFDLPTSGLTPAELQQDLQMCLKRLEAQIMAHPYWWLDLRRNDLDKRLRKPRSNQIDRL